jgi:hypothetical protein
MYKLKKIFVHGDVVLSLEIIKTETGEVVFDRFPVKDGDLERAEIILKALNLDCLDGKTI